MEGRLIRRTLGALKAGLGKLSLHRTDDPRQRINRRWSLCQLLTAMLAGICAGCSSLAEVEALTLVLTGAGRKVLGLGRRVPDTTLRDLLVKLEPTELRGRLWHQVRQAHRQKALKHPWITGHDQGMLNVLILRRIAYNLVALFRGLTQRSEDRRLTPWATVIRGFYIALVAATEQQIAGLRTRTEAPEIR